jgi:electron transfer flavoprotein alpha subunit
MGFAGPENIPVVRQLADAMDGALAATLPTASRKWLASQVQIGLTGKAVAPRFYLAIGVSGQPNHLVGVRKAKHIIAVNNDSEAPIFKSSDFGIVGDWATIVPALTRKIEAAKTQETIQS